MKTLNCENYELHDVFELNTAVFLSFCIKPSQKCTYIHGIEFVRIKSIQFPFRGNLITLRPRFSFSCHRRHVLAVKSRNKFIIESLLFIVANKFKQEHKRKKIGAVDHVSQYCVCGNKENIELIPNALSRIWNYFVSAFFITPCMPLFDKDTRIFNRNLMWLMLCAIFNHLMHFSFILLSFHGCFAELD